MSAGASELVSIRRTELDALKAELKRLRREVGRGVATARIQADSELHLPADDVTIWYTVTEHEGQAVISVQHVSLDT